jgi:hypothetical protein
LGRTGIAFTKPAMLARPARTMKMWKNFMVAILRDKLVLACEYEVIFRTGKVRFERSGRFVVR